MVRGWDDFGETHRESLNHLEPMQVHWTNCAKCNTQRETCAHACVRWGVVCTHTVAFTIFACVWTRNVFKKTHGWWMCKTAKEKWKKKKLRSTWATVETTSGPHQHQFPDASVNMNRLLSSLTMSPTTFGLAILLVATLATVENLPSVENSTMPSFVTKTKKRMKSVSRCASASSDWATPNVVEL